jgi:hypothetical protein
MSIKQWRTAYSYYILCSGCCGAYAHLCHLGVKPLAHLYATVCHQHLCAHKHADAITMPMTRHASKAFTRLRVASTRGRSRGVIGYTQQLPSIITSIACRSPLLTVNNIYDTITQLTSMLTVPSVYTWTRAPPWLYVNFVNAMPNLVGVRASPRLRQRFCRHSQSDRCTRLGNAV